MKMHSENYDVGVIVGRFQVHELHPGHKELLDWVNENHDTMVVMLGCSPNISKTNPLPFNARRVMISELYPDAIILPVHDQRCDMKWSDDLDNSVRQATRPTERVCLYGSRDGFVDHYKGSYNVQKLVSEEPYWSGTEVRQKIINKVRPSADFRAGVIYAQGGDYPRVIPTVDAVIFDSEDREHVYMVRKNGEDQFRFPGGYAESGASYMQAAKREIREEVGDMEVHLEYLGDIDINDWRIGERDTIHTTVFVGHRIYGSVGNFTDSNEIAEVKAFTTTNLRLGYEKSVVPEHHVIVEMLIEYLNKKEAEELQPEEFKV